MQILNPGARQIAYALEGPAGAPVIMFSNSLGTSMAMWQAQASVLARRFRVLRYDTRGHGHSGRHAAHAGVGYTLDDLGADVLRLLDLLDIERVNFCGISMGGMTGLWLGIHAAHRLDRLVVANSAARIGTPAGWIERATLVRADGMQGVAKGAATRWFSADFCQRQPHTVQALLDELRNSDAQGYAACCQALAHADLRTQIAMIATPTLLIAGAYDQVTTIADARFMAAHMPAARTVELNASHLSNVEAEHDVVRLLSQFMGSGHPCQTPA